MTMLILTCLLSAFLSWSTLFAGNPKTLDLTLAVEQGLITCEAQGLGGHTEKSIQLAIRNTGKKALRIRIPAGQKFIAKDSTEQDLINIHELLVALEGGQRRTVSLYANCTEAHDASPGSSSLFLLGAMAGGQLLRVTHLLDSMRLYANEAAQAAIWAVSDGNPLEHIAHPQLALAVAQTLGKEPPAYLIRLQQRSVAGQPAYQYHPLRMEGIFRYELSEDTIVSFGLFNEAGEPVRYFLENQSHHRGRNQFQFQFEISNLPQGQYTARLVDQSGTVIKSMAVRF